MGSACSSKQEQQGQRKSRVESLSKECKGTGREGTEGVPVLAMNRGSDPSRPTLHERVPTRDADKETAYLYVCCMAYAHLHAKDHVDGYV